MADTAAHLVDRVFPIVPVRQRALSLQFALRYRMAYDARLTSDVLNVFIRALTMKILAAIYPPDTTEKILECLGLPSRAPLLAFSVSDFSQMDSF